MKGRQDLAVFLGPKTCLPHCLALVTQHGEIFLECSWKALIDEDFHFPKRARISAFASSNAAMAFSRLTPGNCSRNSSAFLRLPSNQAASGKGRASRGKQVP